jgi:hypothetical protein
MVFTLCIEGYELDLAKSECDNLVDVPYLFISSPIEKKIIEEKETTSNVLPQDYGEVKIQKKITLADVGVKTTPKAKNKGFWGWLVAGLIASAATTAYLLSHGHHHVDTGGPGGAPITPAVPVIPVVPPGGGPGGAPTTK